MSLDYFYGLSDLFRGPQFAWGIVSFSRSLLIIFPRLLCQPPLDFIPASVYNTNMKDVYSVNEAAEKLNLDPSHVRRLLAKGEVKGKKLGRDCYQAVDRRPL